MCDEEEKRLDNEEFYYLSLVHEIVNPKPTLGIVPAVERTQIWEHKLYLGEIDQYLDRKE